MKNTKTLLIQSLAIVFFTLVLSSCEQEDANEPIQSIESVSLESQEEVIAKAGDLRSLVSGPDFRRFNYDANGDRHIDLVAIKTRNTGTRSTEIHVIDGKSNFTKFLIQTGTALHETGSNWNFAPGPTRRDGKFGLQIYAIKKSGTGTRSTEIHVLSQNFHFFKRWLHQSGSVLHETDRSYSFKVPNGRSAPNHLRVIDVFRNGRFFRKLVPGKDY